MTALDKLTHSDVAAIEEIAKKLQRTADETVALLGKAIGRIAALERENSDLAAEVLILRAERRARGALGFIPPKGGARA